MKGRWKWCVRCGRRLHDPESQARGMGDDCAMKPGSRKILDMIERVSQPKLFEETMDGAL